MKHLLILAITLSSMFSAFSQTPVWKKEQLMPTQELADKINNNTKDKPIIFNVGPMDNIKTAVFVGKATSATCVEKMKSTLAMENKTKSVVVYCGCCSYASCPNIKPAYDALMAQGFKNVKVLELPEGIKPDWVAKGFPMEGE
jgi:thiosulfate/3-mercaptopyruvate sulfurtransferase